MRAARTNPSVTVEQLAAGLDLSAAEILRRLERAGLTHLVRGDGTVPMDAIDKIAELARSAPPLRLGGVVQDFMEKSGVARLDAQRAKPNPARVDRPAKGASPRPEPTRSPVPTAAGQQRAEVLREQVLDLEARVADQAAQIAALQAKLEETEREHARQLADGTLRWEAEQATRLARERELTQARQELAAHRAQTPAASVTLQDVFDRRGLVGEDEHLSALRAILDGRRFSALSALLTVTDPEEALALLGSSLVLHCGGVDCPVPQGPVILRVSAPRCEICGGSDVKRGLRRFSETLMLEAVRRVVVVGGSPSYHRLLRDGVDKRVDLRLVAGDARRTRSQAQQDLSWAQLLIIWGGTILDHKVSELYGGAGVRTLRLAHRGLSGMLAEATEALSTPDR